MSNANNPFLEEAYELIVELENALLELEENPDDMDLIGRVFRAMHTIKGSGAMFGYDNIASFTHELESAFDLVREGKISVTSELVNLSLLAQDQIKSMLDASVSGDVVNEAQSQMIISTLRALISGADGSLGESTDIGEGVSGRIEQADEPDPIDDEAEEEMTYRIRFKPGADTFKTGTNPLLLFMELQELGTCRIVAQTADIPGLRHIDPEDCFVYWDIILTTSKGLDAIEDVFIFVANTSTIKIDVIDDPSETAVDMDYKKLGQILIERGDLTEEDIEKAIRGQKRIGEILVESKSVDQGMIDSALAEQELVQQSRKKRLETETASSIRVAADKLDTLVDLVGELVTVQARLSQKAAYEKDSELINISEIVERLTAELRDNTMSIRMMPIGATFSKLKRLVRDLSKELGKEVVMITDGGDTELDKTVIEQLNDPLVHIIRNSIDHGIEEPEARETAGKSRQGSIRLSAEHSGASVLIRIEDDGAGLNPERIREKALSKGLISPDTSLTEAEIFSLIFAPGFSTADSVSEVSGRGVGMDVVKSSIERLRGSVEIDSARGRGTAIVLKLPLTLAIIEGLLVEIARSRYVLPLSAIEQCVELSRQDAARSHGRNVLNIRGRLVPYIPLRKRFKIPGNSPDIEQVVINEVDGQQIGIVVDRVIGERQIVIKTMSRLYQKVQEISGATILGDGTVALIIDVPKLIAKTKTEELAAA